MKEVLNENTSDTISYENISILLFMTQKAISDLKHLKSLFCNNRNQRSSIVSLD